MKPDQEAICPFLNLEDDKTLRFRFPHPKNFCYKPESPQPINLKYQEDFCLKPDYMECPVYFSERKDYYPKGIFTKKLNRSFSLPLRGILFTLILVLGVMLLVLFNMKLFRTSGYESTNLENPTITNQNSSPGAAVPEDSLQSDFAELEKGISPFSTPAFIEDKANQSRSNLDNSRIPITGLSLQNPRNDNASFDSVKSLIETFNNSEIQDLNKIYYLGF